MQNAPQTIGEYCYRVYFRVHEGTFENNNSKLLYCVIWLHYAVVAQNVVIENVLCSAFHSGGFVFVSSHVCKCDSIHLMFIASLQIE